MTDIYERHEVTAFFIADAKLLGAFLGVAPPDPTKTKTGTLGVVKGEYPPKNYLPCSLVTPRTSIGGTA